MLQARFVDLPWVHWANMVQASTVVMTGATSGIGLITALALAEQGARLVCVARSPERGAALLEQLRTLSPGREHVMHYADLSSLTDMRRVAAVIAESETRIDVLMNNAGALYGTRQLTSDHLERTFATNHLAYFVITNVLLERLKSTPNARIVSTASRAHEEATIDFDDLQSERHYQGLAVYARSKLMNILFTRALARRLTGTGVTANCLHPGFVATRFGESAGGLLRLALAFAKKFALSPTRGAQTLLYLATSAEVAGISGEYFAQCRPAVPSMAARNDGDAERLWQVSAALSGVGGEP